MSYLLPSGNYKAADNIFGKRRRGSVR